jgi:hypothetical protein
LINKGKERKGKGRGKVESSAVLWFEVRHFERQDEEEGMGWDGSKYWDK